MPSLKASSPTAPVSLPGVRKIIAIASGKGGVGKSTVAVNLAAAIQQTGLTVGLLDADIYGPSLVKMLDIQVRPQLREDRKLVPVHIHNLTVMSIALVMKEDKAMLWRGPMVMGAIRQMLFDVAWDNLDMLIVDLPPGTGDAQLTLAQSVILDGVVIVSTPQDLALIDALRALNMFRRLDVPVLGVVENMSLFTCDGCGTRYEIFGHGGARKAAESQGVQFLGALPLDPQVRKRADEGKIFVQGEKDSDSARAYHALAGHVMQVLRS